MKRLFLAAFILLFSTAALAKPQTLSWTWPTTDCAGDPLNQADWVSAEIIYDTASMPMPSDTAGPCSGDDPAGPVTATSVPITTPDTSTTLNLQPGITYYARIRVCYGAPDICSNWATEVSFVVPHGKPGPPIWLN